jgi:catechol 2,3-dioxygenase-like lactoylglutathione lyase family enzyme
MVIGLARWLRLLIHLAFSPRTGFDHGHITDEKGAWMLANRRCHATLPVPDVDRARTFYEDSLGFTPYEVRPEAVLYGAGEGTLFAISKSSARPSGIPTQMAFTVPDIEIEVAELRARGVVFEEYDLPGLQTEDSVARIPPGRAAWFFDPDRNLIGIVQFD